MARAFLLRNLSMPFANSLWGTKLYTEITRIDSEKNSELLPAERVTELANATNRLDVWNTPSIYTDTAFSNFISNDAVVQPIDINNFLEYNGGLFSPYKNTTSSISYAALHIVKNRINEKLADSNVSSIDVLFGFLEPADGANYASGRNVVVLLYWENSWYLAHTGGYPVYGIKYFIK